MATVAIAGILRNPQGEPIAGARIDITQIRKGSASAAGSVAAQTTAADGSYAFQLEPGVYRVEVTYSGSKETIVIGNMTVEEGGAAGSLESYTFFSDTDLTQPTLFNTMKQFYDTALTAGADTGAKVEEAKQAAVDAADKAAAAQAARDAAALTKTEVEAVKTQVDGVKTQVDTVAAGAATAKQGAEAAKTGAEAARSQAEAAATLSGNMFRTMAEAQAAITAGTVKPGALFAIISSSDINSYDLYQNVGGTPTNTGKSFPSTQIVNELKQTAPTVSEVAGVTQVSADKEGRVSERLLDNGIRQNAATLVGSRMLTVGTVDGRQTIDYATGKVLKEEKADGSTITDDILTYYTNIAGVAEVWCDKLGRVNRIVYDDGRIETVNSDDKNPDRAMSMAYVAGGNVFKVDADGTNLAMTDDGSALSAEVRRTSGGRDYVRMTTREGKTSGNYVIHRQNIGKVNRIRQGDGDLLHVIITGQSLSVGGSTLTQPPVTTTPAAPYGAMVFNGGPKYDMAYTVSTLQDSDLSYLVPAVENIGKRSGQESDCSGCVERVFAQTQKTSVISATGSSGTSLANISEGTATFEATKKCMAAAYNVAQSMGMRYRPVLLFIHGNEDAGLGTAKDVYKDRMKRLREAYEAYYQTLTGSASDALVMFIEQFSNASVQAGATNANTNLIIGAAQYEMARDYPAYYIFSGTQYARPYGDKDHLTALGYRADGEVAGLSIAAYIKSNVRRALTPKTFTQTSTEIVIELTGGVGAAVIDTARVSNPGNFGFTVEGATITGVTLENGNTVRIAKTGTATSVAYAYTGNRANNPGPQTGSRGCIHDSATETSRYGALPLYNDLVAFYQTL